MIVKEKLSSGNAIYLESIFEQNEFPMSIKIKRVQKEFCLPRALPQTEVLILHNNIQFERVKCLTKTSDYVHIPIDLPKPVKFTPMENYDEVFCTVADVRKNMRKYKIVWLVVTHRFIYNSNIYEVGEVLELLKPSILKRLVRFIARKRRRNAGVTVISHPSKKKEFLPNHLQGNFKKCASPYTSCYRVIRDLIEHEPTPFLITVPINPKTGVVINDGKVTSTKHNQRLLVVGKETFNVVTTEHEDETIENYIIANSAKTEIEIIQNNTTKRLSEDDIIQHTAPLITNFDAVINKKNSLKKSPSDEIVTKCLSLPKPTAELTFQRNHKNITTSERANLKDKPKLLSLKRINSSPTFQGKYDGVAPPLVPPRKKQMPKVLVIEERTHSLKNTETVVNTKYDDNNIEQTTSLSPLPPLPTEGPHDEYLLPVTGFTLNSDTTVPNVTVSTANNTDKDFARFLEYNKNNKSYVIRDRTKSTLSTDEVVEVGPDGYVLVKKQVAEVAPIKRDDTNEKNININNNSCNQGNISTKQGNKEKNNNIDHDYEDASDLCKLQQINQIIKKESITKPIPLPRSLPGSPVPPVRPVNRKERSTIPARLSHVGNVKPAIKSKSTKQPPIPPPRPDKPDSFKNRDLKPAIRPRISRNSKTNRYSKLIE